MITTWRIGTDTPDYGADDLSGTGAKITGGRWNREGNAMVYTASSRALACLETIVHLGAGGLPLNRYLVQISIPAAIWRGRQCLNEKDAPVGWDALPPGLASLDFGDRWLSSKATCVLEVPSSIVSEESNILINPDHPDASMIKSKKIRKWVYDARFRTAQK